MTIGALIDRLFAKSGCDPGFGEDPWKKQPIVALAKVGIKSKELAAYEQAIGTAKRRERVSALLTSAYWNVHPVRTPKSLLFGASPSQLVAFLAGMQPIAEDPDSGAIYAVAWDGSGVASFEFNGGDGGFVVEAPSLEALLRGPKKRPADKAKLERRYSSNIWIAQMLYDRKDWYCDDSADDILAAISDARPSADYKKDRASLGARPDLAASWLLAHALAGRDALLVDSIAATARQKHPAIQELREKLAKPRAIDKLLAKKTSLTADELAQIRAALR